jgi:hypothetical protein
MGKQLGETHDARAAKLGRAKIIELSHKMGKTESTRFEVMPILWDNSMILARPSLAARASWVSPS